MNVAKVLPAVKGIEVVARPHPFSMQTVRCDFAAGLNIRQIVGPNAVAVRVEIGGMTIPVEMWEHVRPKAGSPIPVVVTRYPQGGSAKSIFRLVAFAALAIGVIAITGGAAAFTIPFVGTYFAAGSLSAGILAAGVGLVGSLVINALIPPSTPSAGNSSSTTSLSSITGTGNQIDRYGPIPCVLGTVLFFPPYAALPWTEVLGDAQYLRCLFDLGYGDPEPANMKIGDTDLANYTDVETEIGVNPSLFSQDVLEEALQLEMDTDGLVNVRTTGTATDEISLDLSWAALFGVDSNSNTTLTQCFVMVEQALTGTGNYTVVDASTPGLTISTDACVPWTDGPHTFRTQNSERKGVRVGLRWKVANGQYDVRVTRVATTYGGATGADNQVGNMVWTVLRTIRYSVISTTGTKKLAMRIKATDQLSGSISQFSCILSQKVPVWHADTSTWVTEYSRNPAWLYRWVLRDSPANPRPADPARINDEELKLWAAECVAKGFTYSASLSSTTVFALLKDITAAGRASFTIRDGMYSVVRDLEQTTPVQVFTPRNSSGFGGNRAFPDPVHALRVQFANPEANYQQDERVVYDDGYGDEAMVAASGTPPTLQLATQFEVLAIPGCDDADAAWRLGRYHLAVGRLRPNTYTWNVDVEGLVCNRGDVVLVANDVISVGLGWGRVKSTVSDSNGDAIALVVDERLTAVAGTAYMVRVRRQDGTTVTSNVAFTTFSEETTYLPLATPLERVQPDDLFTYGVLGADTIPMVIARIDPGGDLSAKLTAVDAAPAVLDADAGDPPPWSSQITGQPWVESPPAPEVLIIDSTQQLSTPDDAGTTAVSMLVTLNGFKSGKAGGAL